MTCPLLGPPPPCPQHKGSAAWPVPMVQFACEQDLAPSSTHNLGLTRPQASFPLGMTDVSASENCNEQNASWHRELCRWSPAQRGIGGPGTFLGVPLGEGLAALHQTSFAKSPPLPASAFSGTPLLISESAPKALVFAGLPILRAFTGCLLCAAPEPWAKDIVVSEAGSALPGK